MAGPATGYAWGRREPLTKAAMDRRFLDIDTRLGKSEVQRKSEDEAFAVVLDRVLSRSEGVIANLRDRLLAITELQWLTAGSDTPATLEIGETIALLIREVDRALFAPGPFALLSWTGGDPDHYAIVRTVAYDRELGQWDIRTEAFTGEPGPHDEWQIAAVAGATLAQMALLEQGQIAQAATEAARDDVSAKHLVVVEKHAEVMPAAEQATTARDQAVTAAAGLFPWGFSQDGVFWTATPDGAPAEVESYAAAGAEFVTEAAFGRVLQSNAPGQVLPRGVIAPVPGRRYRAEARARVKTNKTVGGSGAGLDLYQLDAAFGTPVLTAADVLAVEGLPQTDAAFTTADGVVTFALDYLTPAEPPPYLRPRFSWNQEGGDAVVQTLSILIYDVTATYDADQLAASLDTAAINDRLVAIENLSVIRATVPEVRAGVRGDRAVAPADLDAALEPVVVADAATVAWDLAAAPQGVVTINGSRAIGEPTNPKLGKFYSLRINSTGAFSPVFHGCFDFGENGGGGFPSGAGKYGVLDAQCIGLAPTKFRANLWKGA
jgi:hypothetical protein